MTPRTTAISSETIKFNEAVTGFNLSDLLLTRNSGPNLLTAAQTLSTSDHITFTINNLSGLTATPGSYVLTLKTTGSAILASNGLRLVSGTHISWLNNYVALGLPTAKWTPIVTPRTTPVASETITFNQPVTNFDWTDLILTRNGGTLNLLTNAQTLSTTNRITFTLGNLNSLTSVAGDYTLTLKSTDTAIYGSGGKMTTGATVSWHVS